MGLLKWIGGYLGWVTGGPIGALIGYLLGKVFDNGLDSARIGGGQNYDSGQSRSTGGYNTTGRPGYSTDSRSSGGYSAGEQRNSFLISLLVLSSAVIRADGRFLQSETEYVKGFVRRNSGDAASVIAMFYKDTDSAYAVLEISPSASDEEVKSAYRRMAMKNHPDKVASLGPDVQKAAEEKFRKIQEAYERIKKERGMA